MEIKKSFFLFICVFPNADTLVFFPVSYSVEALQNKLSLKTTETA